MKTFRDELEECGCKIDVDEFSEVMADIYAEMFRDMPTERIGFLPNEAIRYCAIVKYRTKSPDVTDEMILRRLANMRKKSYF